jgi:hypothetical protein
MGRGSLGEILPASLVDLFVRAAASANAGGGVTWTPLGSRIHHLRAISGPPEEAVSDPSEEIAD